MRRASITAAVVLLLALPPTAQASDHLMGINEVLLSYQGDTDVQFVELRDTNLLGEPFPSTYRLASYGVAGAPIQSMPLDKSGMASAGSNPYYVATPQAVAAIPGSITPDESMPTGFLDPSGGQVCFEAENGSRRIWCVAYGCVASSFAAQTGSVEVVAPADGFSVQRRANTLGYLTGEPSPRNESPSSGPDAACAGSPGGGPGPGGGTTNDTSAPGLILGGKKRQDVDKLVITVTSNEPATAVVTGVVRVPGASAKVRVRKATKVVAAGVRTKLRIKIKKKAKRRVKSALDDGAKPRARLSVTLTDGAGNRTTGNRKIRLRD